MTKFTSDNTHVLSASDDRKIKYWDLATEQETVSFHEHEVCSQGWCQKFLCRGSRKVQKLQFWKGGGEAKIGHMCSRLLLNIRYMFVLSNVIYKKWNIIRGFSAKMT